ncbi:MULTISPECIES: DUF262 domain-containing protein [unclassified Shewanella]|uniref:DUF262 domain-containing protein n=1 Tax=Shewanella TaxID=22 RepID=UPI0021DB60E2|nr:MULTISPECIES: DUF262 domain-containing protein [unclassified Shewanella]MCU8033686.1 DUF262 domain-containing protein [Shewanella sp. SM71]MCU8095609.1 DUF262 domain-containing protein [Shewanella sp. SM102]
MNKGLSSTFYGLFEKVEIIEIPILQRDYAQGRSEAIDVRTLFLDSLYDALLVTGEHLVQPLDLDFVYGNFEGEEGKVFSVLDGQQRLTTLFLLHWFLALKNDQLDAFRDRFVITQEDSFRSRFTYKTRHSTTEFFNALTSTKFDYKQGSISNLILDSQWFYSSWKLDPTVQSCLCMLDAIEIKFGKNNINLYERLTNTVNPYITFQFLNLHSFGLSDELYIKMNARGKPLTAFENFKVWLLRKAEIVLPHGNFEHKIDCQWTDFFWRESVEDNVDFDSLYLNFFNLLAFYHSCETTEGSYILLTAEEKGWLRDIRESRSYIPHSKLEKIQAFEGKDLNRIVKVLDFMSANENNSISSLFRSAIKTSSNLTQMKFYALMLFIENAPDTDFWDDNTDVQLFRWVRVTNNLINNHRIDDMSSFIAAIKALNHLSKFSQSIYEQMNSDSFETVGFTKEQWSEEVVKANLILTDTNWESPLRQYESHTYLKGKVGFILNMAFIDNSYKLDIFQELAKKISTLLSPEVLESTDFLLQRALLSIDNYLIEDGYCRLSFGVPNRSSYRERSENWLSIVTKPVFTELVMKISSSDYGTLTAELKSIIDSSNADGWRELIIKYPDTIGYCSKKLIHRQGQLVYLLSKTNRRGYHAELYSYVLSLRIHELESQRKLPTGIETLSYEYVYGDETPKARLKLDGVVLGVCFKFNKYVVTHKVPHTLYHGYLVDEEIETPDKIVNLLLSLGIEKGSIS